MNIHPLKLRFLRLVSRRRIQIIILILGLQILFIGPISLDLYSWGSFRGVARYIRVTDTHQDIIKAAFSMLTRDPAITKTRFPLFGDFSVITADDILQYEGVDVSRDNMDWSFRTEGPGPDADGSTPYSWHWCNPVTNTGYAPRAAADQYMDFAMAALRTNFSRERALKGMAWPALQPVIKVTPDPAVPGKVIVSTLVSNYAQEACQNVWIRLTVMDGSAIAYQGNMPLTVNLPGTQSAWVDWSFQGEQNKSYIFFMEVVGAYMVTPDFQYAYCSLAHQTGAGSQNTEPEVFGNNQWIQNSLAGDIYYLPEGTTQLPDFAYMQSVGRIYTKSLNIPERAFDSGFPDVTSRFEWFAIRYTGEIRIRADREGNYDFRLTSDDGSTLLIDNKVVIDNDGQHATAAVTGSIILTEGIHKIEIEYFQGPRLHVALIFEVTPPGSLFYSIFNKDDYLYLCPWSEFNLYGNTMNRPIPETGKPKQSIN